MKLFQILGVMMDIETFEKQALQSLLFTAPVLGDDMGRFLKEKSTMIKELATQAIDESVEHIYWVGAGNSRVNLLSGKELMDRFTNIPSDCYCSYEFMWRSPERLGKNAWVFLASFSGATEDTVEALRYAKNRGAKTIAFVDKANSLMGREADIVIDYTSKGLYILPLAGSFLFVLELAKKLGNSKAAALIKGLNEIPALLKKQYVEEKTLAKESAEKFRGQEMIYTLGTGPLYGLAYKFGLTVFMENMRVNGSFMETAEFRHGPAEMFDRHKPAFVILVGTDESRPVSERVIKLIEHENSPLLIFDAKKYHVDPLLEPFVLMIPLQWFAIYSAYIRGIYDLDERVLMGHGIMGKGSGVTWP